MVNNLKRRPSIEKTTTRQSLNFYYYVVGFRFRRTRRSRLVQNDHVMIDRLMRATCVRVPGACVTLRQADVMRATCDVTHARISGVFSTKAVASSYACLKSFLPVSKCLGIDSPQNATTARAHYAHDVTLRRAHDARGRRHRLLGKLIYSVSEFDT